MKRPVLWVLGFLIFGIIAGREGGIFFALFFVAAIFVCAGLYLKYKFAPVVIFLVFFLAGAWRVEHSLHSHITVPAEAVFSGIVIDTGYTAGGNQRAVVRGEDFRIMAYIQPHQPHVNLGQKVTLRGEILPLSRAENPGGYDQFMHLRPLKIDATIWPEEIHIGETRRTLTTVLRQTRDRFAAVYDEILPAREAAVMKSMILGDRLDLDRDLADLYRAMGIFHILSISGLHITILMVAANKLLSLLMNERRAGAIVLGVTVLYCLMTGAAVPTVRAVTMGGVLVGAKLLHREYDLLASVAVACAALLIFEPLYLFGAGFQLSFGAVFGIGVLTAPVERLLAWLKFPKRNAAWLKFRKSLAVGIAAVVSTYIVFAFHFYEIPLYSVLGNLVIMPTVTVILVLGVVVGLVGPVFMPAAAVLSGAVYFILRFYEAAATFFSNLPHAMLLTGGGNIFISALGVLVLATFAWAMHEFGENFWRRIKIFAACVALLIAAVFIQSNPLRPQMTELYTPGKYKILRYRADTLIIGAAHGGEADLSRYLDMRGTRRAALLLTHPPRPQDAARLARILPRVHTLYLPAHAEGATESLMFAALEGLPTENIRIIFLENGDKRVSGATVRVFALPLGRFEVIVE